MSFASRVARPLCLVAVASMLCLAAMAIPAPSAAGTVTFDGLVAASTSYAEDGALLVTTGSFNRSDYGSPSMFSGQTSAVITLTLDGGGPFNLVSMDVRELNDTVGAQTIVFEGTLAAGGTVSTTVDTDGACCSSALAYGFETVAFPASFSNLVAVSWDHVNPEAFAVYDNIVVAEQATPVEATTWGAIKVLIPVR